MTASIQTLNLSKDYGAVTALDDVSVEIAAGEIFCLLGPNGAGKTTLLNVILGFVQPTSGRALVKGIDVAERLEDARRVMAYVPELVVLYPSLSAIENLRFFSDLAGHRRDGPDLERCLSQAGLDLSHAHRRVSTFSKGMRQKVGIAVAIAKQAEVLLLDEPTSGLDPESADELVRLIGAMAARGCAVLLTTHDLLRASASGGRVGIMRRGRLAASFRSEDVRISDLEREYLKATR